MGGNLPEKVGIIGGGLAPYFNEAMANQMYLLSKKLNAQVITCNDIGLIPSKKMGQYFIVNTKFIMRRTPVLSFINGAVLYAVIKLYERKFDVIIIPGGIDSEFLNYLNLRKCIPVVTSLPFVNESVENKIKKIALKLRGMIAQSNRTKNQLISMGVDPGKIILMYPLIELSKFRYSEPLPANKFKILFASSPNLEVPGENNFRDKGVPLLLEAFKEFIKEEDAILYIVWRGKYNKELYQMINRLDLKDYVKVIDRVVNMPEMYAKVHVTVIPFLNLWRSPDIPLSAVESLACARPVVATDVGEISELIQRYKCGCVAKPLKDDFLMALKECQRNYQNYQRNCRGIVETLSNFDLEKTIISGNSLDVNDEYNEDKKVIYINQFTRLHIGILIPSMGSGSDIFLSKRIKILEALSDDVLVITSGSKYSNNKLNVGKGSIFQKIYEFILMELRTTSNLVRLSKNIDVVLFTLTGGTLLLPQLVAKLLRKKTMFFRGGSTYECVKFGTGGHISPLVTKILEKINYVLADWIVLNSKGQIEHLKLTNYKSKILPYSATFVDTDTLQIKKRLSERKNLVGFIGRMAGEKGINNFVQAALLILKQRDDVEFLIGGEGPLFDEIKCELEKNKFSNRATLEGWIPHDKIQDYLNELKLLVIPSYTEGLPNIMLEAMACGTPVLATPVGAIPDIIKDGETGFILDSNFPESIAKGITSALEYPDLDVIAKNAHALIEEKYTYHAAVERYRKMFSKL